MPRRDIARAALAIGIASEDLLAQNGHAGSAVRCIHSLAVGSERPIWNRHVRPDSNRRNVCPDE